MLPCPITSTVSSISSFSSSIAFRQVLTGSMNAACSKEMSSGSLMSPPSTIQGITRMYSANPPPAAVNPAVVPTLLIGLALREGLLAAVETFAAGDVMEGHHTVADCELRSIARGDGPGHLVPEDARPGMRVGMDLLEVRAADAAGIDADEHLVRADLRCGDLLYFHLVLRHVGRRRAYVWVRRSNFFLP